jgi:glucose/mannose transport system permease protein
MVIRWSRIVPQMALAPAVTVTLVAFVGSILWTVYLSFTRSRRLPDYAIDPSEWGRNYLRLFRDTGWTISLQNLIVLGLGSALAIVLGFILAAMIDKEKRGESIFRTVFLYPLAVSLIVTGAAWRWMFNPTYGVEAVLHGVGLTWINFSWLARPDTAMYGIILAAIWQGSGFYMALMLAGLKSINSEIWSAAKLDGVPFWRLYGEIIIPMMKFTFITCAILLSLGVIKAYDLVVAMTGGGPGQSTYVPAYFTIQALSSSGNLGYAASAATMMLVITAIIFLPLVLISIWRRRRAEAAR